MEAYLARAGALNISAKLAAISLSFRKDLGQHFSAVLVVTALAIFVYAPPLISYEMALGWGLLIAGVAFSQKQIPHPVPLLGGVVIAGSALVAVPLTAGTTWLEQTVVLAILTGVLFPLLFVRNGHIWGWLVPVWLIHAAWSAVDVYAGELRVTGLSGNANVASAFLLLGCVYLTNGNSRLKWLVLPLVAVIPFTGSRWAAAVLVSVMVSIFMSRYVSWRYLALGIAFTVVLVSVLNWQIVWEGYYRPSTLQEHLVGVSTSNIPAPEKGLSFIPKGFWDSGIHNVPWRMANETGVLSALAWLVVTAYGLLRDRFSSRWWMLLAVALISMMYYHTWIGPLGAFWWLLVNPQEKPRISTT